MLFGSRSRGDPPDGARDHACFEGVKGEAVRALAREVEHFHDFVVLVLRGREYYVSKVPLDGRGVPAVFELGSLRENKV